MIGKNIQERNGSFKSQGVLLFASAIISLLLPPMSVEGQAPSVLWSTNVGSGAAVFAVDSQTNVYAYNSGSVIVVNSAGVMLSSNLICPAAFTSSAGRDTAGNYYFAGSYGGVQDFGGISLTNGTGTGPCFTAKYNNAGVLQWVKGFGPTPPWFLNSVGNIQFDAGGNIYVAYNFGYSTGNGVNEDNQAQVMRFDSNGSSIIVAAVDAGSNPFATIGKRGAARVGAVTTASGALLNYFPHDDLGSGGNLLKTGFWTNNTDGAYYPLVFPTDSPLGYPPPINAGFAVPDLQGNIISLQGTSFMKMSLASNVLVNVTIGSWWTVAGDIGGGVHVANNSGQLARYDTAGNQVWLLGLNSSVNAMALDSHGNRFFSLYNGVISRLAGDYFAPSAAVTPQTQTVLAGSNAMFTATPSGSTPISYSWLFGTSTLPGQTNATLMLNAVSTNQSGQYSIVVSNYAGMGTSAPVTLRVKSVAVFAGAQLLTNGTYTYNSPPSFTIKSAFAGGQTFYTLDGSTPSFLSTPYSGPFMLSSNSVINAIAYSSDFTQVDYADSVTAIVPPQYTVMTSTAGGGTISLNPPGGVYASNTTVTLTANPAPGFSFLNWQGATAGMGQVATLVVRNNLSVNAVFGTTLATTAVGGGQVLGAPSGQVYPYGAVLRLEALPQAGNYFALWGNAASGSSNPLYFSLTNSGQTVSSLFAAVPANQAALTVLIVGKGTINVSPAGNVFPTSQSVIITATPDSGQTFLGWSGDATGLANPLNIGMTQNRVITAHFSGQGVALSGAGHFTAQGFQITLTGDPQSVYHLYSSTNLSAWQDEGYVTNNSGATQFTDTNTAGPFKYYRAVVTQ